jgi:K+-transporting ATPase KdpF subunit
VRPALNASTPPGDFAVLILTAIIAVAALVYLGYAMIRPERF